MRLHAPADSGLELTRGLVPFQLLCVLSPSIPTFAPISVAPSLPLLPVHARSLHLFSRPQLAQHAEEMRKQEEEQKRLDFEARVGTFFFFSLRV